MKNAVEVPDLEDEELVWMAASTILGVTMRVAIFVAARKTGVKPVFTLEEVKDLFTLTDAEKALIRPTVPFVAPELRKVVGANRTAALITAASVFGGGVIDRCQRIEAACELMAKSRGAAQGAAS